MRWLVATRRSGSIWSGVRVLLGVENGRAIFGLENGDTLSFDLHELRAELAIEESASEAETQVLGGAA